MNEISFFALSKYYSFYLSSFSSTKYFLSYQQNIYIFFSVLVMCRSTFFFWASKILHLYHRNILHQQTFVNIKKSALVSSQQFRSAMFCLSHYQKFFFFFNSALAVPGSIFFFCQQNIFSSVNDTIIYSLVSWWFVYQLFFSSKIKNSSLVSLHLCYNFFFYISNLWIKLFFKQQNIFSPIKKKRIIYSIVYFFFYYCVNVSTTHLHIL